MPVIESNGSSSHLAGKPCTNPYQKRNAEKMKARGAKWNFISKLPIYQYNGLGLPQFVGFSKGITYYSQKNTGK